MPAAWWTATVVLLLTSYRRLIRFFTFHLWPPVYHHITVQSCVSRQTPIPDTDYPLNVLSITTAASCPAILCPNYRLITIKSEHKTSRYLLTCSPDDVESQGTGLLDETVIAFVEAGTRAASEPTATVFRGMGTGGGLLFAVTEHRCRFSTIETPYVRLLKESSEDFRLTGETGGNGGCGWVDFDSSASGRPGMG